MSVAGKVDSRPELPTGQMDPRVGSGWVTILPDFGGLGRVGSALKNFQFLLIISGFLNRYEFSNSKFGLIVCFSSFLRYLIFISIK